MKFRFNFSFAYYPLRWLYSFLFLTLILIGCEKEKNNKDGNFDSLFYREPEEPVIESGTVGWPIFPTDPCVIVDEDGYHLFYTSFFCNSNGTYNYSWDAGNLTACDILDAITAIGYAYSDDKGYTWTFRNSPVASPGNALWHNSDLETPFVTLIGDTLYLFYSATGTFTEEKQLNDRFQVGIASLPLHKQSIKECLFNEENQFELHMNPLLPFNNTTASYDNNTQEPSVIVKDKHIELYYIGVGLSNPEAGIDHPQQSITSVGLAKAVFDLNFNLIEKSGGYILPWANITEVKYYDSTYHVFGTTLENGEFHQNEKINYYSSKDGLNWSNPSIILASEVSSENWGIMAPTISVETNKIIMFYTAWSKENHACFPEEFSSSVRFGHPYSSDSKCIYGSVMRVEAPR